MTILFASITVSHMCVKMH